MQDVQPSTPTEKLGAYSLFMWHCRRPMRRLLAYVPNGKGGVRRLGDGIPFSVGHVCSVCGMKQMKNFTDM